jgi:hypothetical protein
MVVLAAQLEVAQHHGDLCTREAQDDEHQGQEAKEVVELVEPHAGQDEEQLCRIKMRGSTGFNRRDGAGGGQHAGIANNEAGTGVGMRQ